jgi:3-hydroxyisobutyrate dehydrogenase-like beta-hydroxyacid dehydrogenase
MKVGFIGLGLMGSAMASNLLKVGHELATAHAERGIDYVAAPIFGRPEAAAAGKLNILAAGPSGAIERVRPLFEAMRSRIWPLGGRAGMRQRRQDRG